MIKTRSPVNAVKFKIRNMGFGEAGITVIWAGTTMCQNLPKLTGDWPLLNTCLLHAYLMSQFAERGWVVV